ncbi:MAG: hypothetical protein WAO02_11840 [Verrucomicrobiia bacterium]
MKTILSLLCGLGCWWFDGGMAAMAGDPSFTNLAPVRIGLYDSRAVAYAHFWSESYQLKLKEQMAAARAAKQAGDTARFKALGASLRQTQDQLHRQVFSTASADDALDALKGQVPEIESQAGVTALVSKWDVQALAQYKPAETVDVTGQLVREFKPAEKQLKVIADLQKHKPLSLEKCDELIRQGKI